LRALARPANSDELEPIGVKPLPYSTKAVVFEFAAPDFARRPSLRLESLLEGVDHHWIPADPSSRREFTPLREGRYDFRVRAVAETGVAGPATVSHFEIMPPWWRTGTALACALLALGPAGYGAYRWRVRTLRQRNAELEAKVRERTAQLAQANAAKTQFVANVSHDIRNPLNGIVGLALALEDSPLNAKQSEAVATLRECTNYLSTLVDDVLDFASIEAGEVVLRPAPFSPGELLRSVAAMFKPEATAGGASLEVDTDLQLPALCTGDAGRIQQILVNFLTNALKYSGGGRIRLTATVPAAAPDTIEFAVTDEGPGISEEEQPMLFTKFTRLRGLDSQAIAGTGLGLASCRLLAGMMKGVVGVSSSPGRGARFHLRLPLVIVPPSAPPSVGAAPPVPLRPDCKVLLVEDTEYNALAAAAVLDKFGLTCEHATTGAAALELFAGKRHDLVLLDRNLPDMDGLDVARRIRALETNGTRTTMLAVTAYCTSEERRLCLDAGMNGFVGKPLTPEKLRRVLTDVGRHLLVTASSPDTPGASSA
jgi:signal transduction histidine kinase/CheY-like chemotaxis protein